MLIRIITGGLVLSAVGLPAARAQEVPRVTAIGARVMSRAAVAQATIPPVTVRYREPADIFEILDNVSGWWPGYCDPAYARYWADSIRVAPGDSALMARYAQLRARYVDTSGVDTTGQASATPGTPSGHDRRGLFSDPAALDADPVADAFYGADSLDEAFAQLRRIVAAEDVAFLRAFFAHFGPRVAPLVAETRARTAASRARTAATLTMPEVAAYLGEVQTFFGVPPVSAPRFTALYVWWPTTEQTRATPKGHVLVLRVRPAPDDTVNSADVVAHEAIHVYAALQPAAQRQRVSAAVLERCTVPTDVARLAVVEEPIATALGNIEFRRRFEPTRFSWSRRWYGNVWIELSARLLYPVLTAALAAGRPLDAALGRDAGAMCALVTRARERPAQGTPSP